MVRYSMHMPAKRLRTAVSGGGGGGGSESSLLASSSAGDGVSNMASVSSFATFDVETLDCSICMEALSPPIFQCSNGHIACHSCHSRVGDSCPSCSTPIGKIRNLVLEKLIETLRVTCRYADNGCVFMPKFTQKAAHERHCEFRPCQCPVKPCVFSATGKEMAEHLLDTHQVSTCDIPAGSWYTLWLNASDTHLLVTVDGLPFLLRHDKEVQGSRINVSCFGQPEYLFEIEVKNGKKKCLFEGAAQSIAQEYDESTRESTIDYYVIPQHMYPKEGHLQLQIRLKRPGGSGSVNPKVGGFSESLF